ncbi:copper chaperone PCu(A)C [Actinomarinicola tropica]|uniref:Copper chaperone PCu(A)C n=1 Tax=Actinomarinicola tropica TaxID=2789776 RepID=A0A5Q2RPS2_9ACTN|nr:copper chaperone PCu(A)C [Actinomarinicola tropica]QGG95880.1 copper chaperone PCu(A)C [Actinomarinicola tropica]
MTPRTHRALVALGIAALIAGAAACGDDDDDTTSSSETTAAVAEETTTTDAEGEEPGGEVTVEDAWARTSPMMAANGAAYMRITSPVDDRLVAASVSPDVAMTTEVHETSMSDDGSGEMMMQEVDGIDLPAGETVALEPGGYHVMLMGLTEPLEVGGEIEITLELESGGTVTVTAEVRDA